MSYVRHPGLERLTPEQIHTLADQLFEEGMKKLSLFGQIQAAFAARDLHRLAREKAALSPGERG